MTIRVLFITPQLPYPAHQGTSLRNFGLIAGLSKERDIGVALLSFADPGQPLVADTPLSTLCYPALSVPAPLRDMAKRVIDLVLGQADLSSRRWSTVFDNTLRDLLHQYRFDVIQIEGLEMAPYIYTIKELSPDSLVIYDAHNAEFALQARITEQDRLNPLRLHYATYSYIQARRLRELERKLCATADMVFACSRTDADHLESLGHGTPVQVVPNAIETRNYRLAGRTEASIVRPSMVFTGKMDFRPNVDAALWFASDILPLIRSEVPEAHFTIVGQQPHARLEGLTGKPGITLTGFVPEIQPYIRATDVFVAPLRMGSGTRFKLLQAMAMTRAVVSTSLGAEGIDIRDQYHLYLADTPEAFAEAVIKLLRNENWRLEIGFNANKLVHDSYDWPIVIPRVLQTYRELVRQQQDTETSS